MIYIQHDSEGDTYFKALLLKQYLYKLKKKPLYRHNWRVKKHRILMENESNK